MQTFITKLSRTHALLFCSILGLTGCQQFSELESDKSAGLNGGFEITRNDMPVNWMIYSPNTVPNAEFDIVIDTSIFKEGTQSLRFDIDECAASGGWGSPGFTNEFFEAGKFEGEGNYKLSFWIRNHGSRYRISAGGVSPMKGDMKVLIEASEELDDWTFFEFNVAVAESMHLRMELNILEPGTFWIDDIQVLAT